jgi:hypothetical protein
MFTNLSLMFETPCAIKYMLVITIEKFYKEMHLATLAIVSLISAHFWKINH